MKQARPRGHWREGSVPDQDESYTSTSQYLQIAGFSQGFTTSTIGKLSERITTDWEYKMLLVTMVQRKKTYDGNLKKPLHDNNPNQ